MQHANEAEQKEARRLERGKALGVLSCILLLVIIYLPSIYLYRERLLHLSLILNPLFVIFTAKKRKADPLHEEEDASSKKFRE